MAETHSHGTNSEIIRTRGRKVGTLWWDSDGSGDVTIDYDGLPPGSVALCDALRDFVGLLQSAYNQAVADMRKEIAQQQGRIR